MVKWAPHPICVFRKNVHMIVCSVYAFLFFGMVSSLVVVSERPHAAPTR